MERCIQERGVFPTIVAVDFAGRGDLVATADEHAEQLRSLLGGVDEPAAASSTTVAVDTSHHPVRPLRRSRLRSAAHGFAGHAAHRRRPDRVLRRPAGRPQDDLAWALGTSTEPDDEVGQRDLAFGPALARHLPAFISAAPAELAAEPSRCSTAPASRSPRWKRSGWDDGAIAGLADRADQALSAVTGLGHDHGRAGHRGRVVAEVGDRVGLCRGVLLHGQPATPDLFDLGNVPDEVGWRPDSGAFTPAGLIDLDQGS